MTMGSIPEPILDQPHVAAKPRSSFDETTTDVHQRAFRDGYEPAAGDVFIAVLGVTGAGKVRDKRPKQNSRNGIDKLTLNSPHSSVNALRSRWRLAITCKHVRKKLASTCASPETSTSTLWIHQVLMTPIDQTPRSSVKSPHGSQHLTRILSSSMASSTYTALRTRACKVLVCETCTCSKGSAETRI